MLVHNTGRHHRPEDLQLPSSSSTNFFSPSYSLSPNPPDFHSPQYPTDYPYDSRPSTPSDHSALSPIASPYMTTTSSQNPPIRLFSSTPNQLSQPLYGAPSSMPDNYSAPEANWDFANNYHLSPQLQQQHSSPAYRTHKRFSSGSTIGSAGPDSPYTNTQGLVYPYIVDPDSVTGASQQLEPFDGAYSATQHPKSASAPANYPYESIFAPAFINYNPSTYNAESLMATQAAMKQALGQQRGNQNMDGGAPSRRSYGEGYENNVPKFSRTLTDVYQDELYQPAMTQSAPVLQPRPVAANQPDLLSPYNSVFSERLQEANQARSASPTSSVSRGKSPFRETSQFASDGFSAVASNPHSPATRLNSAARMREQAKAESDAIALAQHQPRNDDLVAPNTISPKEAFLDYHETEHDAKMPLFPQETRQKRSRQSAAVNTRHETINSNANQESSNYAASTVSSQQSSNYTFMPPSVPPPQYPFMARRQSSIRSTSDQVPEFPAHLTSMESTKSESSLTDSHPFPHGLPSSTTSSQQSQSSSSPILQRPSNTAADSGTYTCTAPSCSARFDTAAKLHKHRRDSHPSSPPRTPSTPYPPSSASHTPTSATFPSGASSSTAAANRNLQSGPHRCERTNPSTGKPCNTVFSRSYDLTRHEDTIHNGKKQKVRCRLCTEEKTFSRNDALTRHMRVVHPEVDFPGKKARRGG